MREKITGKAGRVVAAGVLTAAGLGVAAPASAATAATPVACSAEALSNAIAKAASGATLSLAANCTYVLAHALPTVAESLSITGNRATLERSRAAGTPAFTILTATGSSVVSIKDLSFKYGDGAISLSGSAQLTVTGGTFTDNHAANGGAIDSNAMPVSPVLTGVTFTGNTATGNGGAVYDNNAAGGASISHCTFTGNSAGRWGGAFFEFATGSGGIFDSVLRGNTAQNGGALYLSEDSLYLVSSDTISDNKAADDGGGIYAPAGGDDIAVENGSVSGNKAGELGGGIYSSSEFWEMTGVTVTDNTAADGGGVYNDQDATLELSGGTFSGNRATADGGGFYNSSTSGRIYASVSATGSAISDNHAADAGGGLYNQGFAGFTGSTIDGNRAPGGGGGIYDTGSNAMVALDDTPVTGNKPDNCEPLGSITGCTG
jgi:Chlamydia polymorphic membrane protein (Chlamydia_PMP) repeat